MSPPGSLPKIPDFEVIRRIGGGAYGDVYLARSLTAGYRAIKVVRRAAFDNEAPYEREFEGVRRFAELSLREPRQLALLHVGRNDAEGFFYSVMELADDVSSGSEIHPDSYVPATLEEVRRQRGRLPVDEVIALGVELGAAIGNLHAAGFVHRDIKPANVILVRGVPKLADVGLVCLARDQATLVGTPGYLPQEGPGLPTADVFAFGKTLYVLGFGEEPGSFPGLPRDIDTLPGRDTLMELNAVLLRACARRPEERYSNAAEMADDLRLVSAGHSIGRLRRIERRLAVAKKAGAALAALTALVAIIALWQGRTARRERTLRVAVQTAERTASEALMLSRLSLAQNEITRERFGRARDYLREVWTNAPVAAPFEWRILWREAQGMTHQSLPVEGPTIEGLAFSPDGTRMAARTAAKELVVWETASRKLIRRTPGLQELAGFSPARNAWVGIGPGSGTAPDTEIRSWSPDGLLLGTHSIRPSARPILLHDGRVVVYRPNDPADAFVVLDATGRETNLTTRLTPAQSARDLWWHAVAPDGVHYAVVRGGTNGTTRDVVLESGILGKAEPIARHDLPEIAWSLDISPDGRWVAVGLAASALVEVFRLPGLERHQTIHTRHRKNVGKIAFSPDSTQLATGGAEGMVSVWNITGTTPGTEGHLTGLATGIRTLAWAPDGRSLATMDQTQELRLWHPGDPQRITVVTNVARDGANFRSRATVSEDGAMLAYSEAGDRICLVRIDGTGTPSHLAVSQSAPLAFIHGGSEIVVQEGDFQIGVWNVPTRARRAGFQLLDPTNRFLNSVAISRDRRWVATTTANGQLAVGNLESGQVQQIPMEGQGNAIAPGPDDASFLTLTGDDSIQLWDAPSLKLRWSRRSKTDKPVADLSMARQQDQVVLGDKGGSLYVLSLEDGSTRKVAAIRSPALCALQHSPDGTRLLVGCVDGYLGLFDSRDFSERIRLDPDSQTSATGQGGLSRASFHPAGRGLTAILPSGQLRLWSE